MSWTSLQMISLGSLLLIGDRSLCFGGPRCIDEAELQQRRDKFQKKLEDTGQLMIAEAPAQPHEIENLTCEQAAKQLPAILSRGRSISPWKYWEDIDENRIPRNITVAKCLCEGCIIDGEVSYNYNSVEVNKRMKVMYISKCTDDPSKHVIALKIVDVAVGCICVVPKY